MRLLPAFSFLGSYVAETRVFLTNSEELEVNAQEFPKFIIGPINSAEVQVRGFDIQY